MTPNQTIFSPIAGGAKKATYTGTAGATVALASNTTAVWILTTSDAFVRVGGTAVADQDLYVPAFVPVVLGAPGSTTVSAVQVTAGGTLYVTPIA